MVKVSKTAAKSSGSKSSKIAAKIYNEKEVVPMRYKAWGGKRFVTVARYVGTTDHVVDSRGRPVRWSDLN